MKTPLALLMAALLGGGSLLHAQTKAPPAPPTAPAPPGSSKPFPTTALPANPAGKNHPDAIPMDLNFPGGTPAELVEVMEVAIGRKLNVVFPEDQEAVRIPALKMSRVTASQVFAALEQVSRKQIQYVAGSMPGGAKLHQVMQTGYGFYAAASDDAGSARVWVFQHTQAPEPETEPKVCRFYQLGPYLQEANLKVEDITTAIQTGWRMLKIANMPEVNFHKETQLLIVVGGKDHLTVIDEVLRELSHRQGAVPIRIRGGGGFGGGFGTPPAGTPAPPSPTPKKER